MQALDEAEAARRVALETWQQRVASLVARVENLSKSYGERKVLDKVSGHGSGSASVGRDVG